MLGGVGDAGRGRGEGLHDHLAAGRAAAAAAGELGDHREGALAGAEVGEAQGGVGVEDRAQGHLGEVVALGDHLGADQDGALGLAEGGEDAGVGTAPGGGVGVEPEDRHRRQPLGQQRLDLLGADAGARERGRVADRRRRWAAVRDGRSGGRRGGRCGGGRSARRRSWGSSSADRRSGR